MFRQLKARLLSLNTISIVLLMFIAFSSIYGLTYQKTLRDIDNLLKRVENFNLNTVKSTPNLSHNTKTFNEPIVNLANREVFFIINLSNDSKILSTSAFISAEEDFFEEALSLVQNENGNIIELDDAKWAYRIVHHKDFYQIFFTDVTKQLAILDKLLYTFIAIFISMVALTFLVSNYLTNVSIIPIKAAFEKQNQFISDASHELKTPLAVINANVDVLLSKPSDESSKKWLTYIQSEVERMTKLTENLLYLSQFDHPKIDYQYQLVNLSETLEYILLGLEAVAFEKNIKLSYQIEPDLRFEGHSEQLSQVMMILIDNAIKYCDSKINVRLFSSGSIIKLEVNNDGEMISEKDIPHIFDRFYKADVSRSMTSGYGLGLPIAQSIIKQHKGKIHCKSDEYLTTFTVKLAR